MTQRIEKRQHDGIDQFSTSILWRCETRYPATSDIQESHEVMLGHLDVTYEQQQHRT